MKKKITITSLLVMLSLSMFSQGLDGQFSIEAGYGLGFSGRPALTNVGSYNVGLRYMFDEYWGIKGDVGADKFRKDEVRYETGVDYVRLSAQAVYNIGRALDWPAYTDGYINGYLHAGMGYSRFKSTETRNIDNMGNIIIGITPQIYLSEAITLHGDASYVFNFKQHFDYDGFYHYPGPPKAFIGGQANLTIGLTFYIGKTSSDYDWR